LGTEIVLLLQPLKRIVTDVDCNINKNIVYQLLLSHMFAAITHPCLIAIIQEQTG